MPTLGLTFVVAVNDRSILKRNLLASPCLQDTTVEVLELEGYASAASAYNAAIKQAANDLIVFVHQDVFLPADWISQLLSGIDSLENSGAPWGVIGCCGKTQDGIRLGHLYTPGEGVIGAAFAKPERVRVLDEVVLVVRKCSGLRFGEDLPGFHFYGTHICLSAAEMGLSCYAISAFCIHNSRQYFDYPPEFYTCYRHIKRRWSNCLPIHTPCICVSRFDWDIWKRRIKRFAFGLSSERGARIEDPRILMREIQAQAHLGQLRP